ncbi:tryptophan 7-halogenase [Streptomyces johnsoniae]|uniref:Tryptophan 7-halogenase n=1 Tax=Streptomyces johnsoniae TaxID=3075532 RepID=A0ABU2RWC7_9ACTN|nr:tryptophan 7-halogenase [Streptomyces sp. DSM 41886]MDT0441057.1 tryptophan 7-halogenase [Streptomyces sp. DSM 41886]
MHKEHAYDVAILGSGLAGTILGACLARNGVRVLLLDAGKHPRFAIGESTIPHMSMMLKLVGERYQVPEVKYLSNFELAQENVTRRGGIKRNFGYLYHREGLRQNSRETHQFPIPKILAAENHFFREDTDSFMLSVAKKYGVTVREQTKIVDVHVDEQGVDVIPEAGEPYRARYVVDASGFRSPLAQKFDLRQQPTRLRHHSRSLFTHMEGVLPYEATVPKRRHDTPPTPWSQGTLHHVFHGGWLWVIPFDNHPGAASRLCSVGLNLDPRLHPVPDCSPEEEFRQFIAKYPDMGNQFRNARPVRDWVRTGRLQYSSKQTVGYRWCLTSHAAGFVDPLYSRGLLNSLEIINALGWRLLDALRDDDFDVERFAYVQQLEQGLLDFNDDLVASSYTSWEHFDLWDVCYRMWGIAQGMSVFESIRSYAEYRDTHDPAVLARLERQAPEGTVSEYRPVHDLLRRVHESLREVRAGRADPAATAAELMADLRGADFVPPVFGLNDPELRWTTTSPLKIVRTLRWAKYEAPKEVGDLTFEGLTFFLRKRLSRREYDLMAELKHTAAGWPVIGRPLRSLLAKG